MTAPLQSRITRHGEADPTELIANPDNWRTHPREQVEALEAILDDVGWVQDVILNERTGRIIDGHLRVRIAVERAEPTVPVVYVDLSEEEERLVLATLDPITGMAGADPELLAKLLAEIAVPDGLESVLQEIIARAERTTPPVTDPDAVPNPPPEETEIVPGTLVRMGPHRLLCGDSTLAAPYERLTGEVGTLFDLCFTDPPYGVAYDGGPLGDRDAIAGDADLDVLLASLPHIATTLKTGGALYLCHASNSSDSVVTAMREHFTLSTMLVWAKNSLVMGRGDYHYRHEPIAYGWTPGAAHYFTPIRSESTVWEEAPAEAVKALVEDLTIVGYPFDTDPVLAHRRVAEDIGTRRPTLERWLRGEKPMPLMARLALERLTVQSTVWEHDRPKRSAEHPTMKPVALVARAILNSSRRGEAVLDPFSGSGSTLIACEQQGRVFGGIELEPHYVRVALERWQNYTGQQAVIEVPDASE